LRDLGVREAVCERLADERIPLFAGVLVVTSGDLMLMLYLAESLA
jgi:hypothetical protein